MSHLASVSNTLKIWNFAEDNLLLNSTADFFSNEEASPTHRSDLLALSWNHNQQVIAVGGSGQRLNLVQANNGQTLSSLPIDEKDQFLGDIRALSFSHNSRYLASAIDRDVAVWDLKKRNVRVRLSGHKAVIRTLQFSNDGAIVSGDTSGAMIHWNVEQNSRSKDLLNPGYRAPLNCLRLSPGNQRQICCGYGDGCVTVWDAYTLAPLNRCTKAHGSAVTSLAYSPKNDRLVVTGGKEGDLNIVDLGAQHDKYTPAVSFNVGEAITSVSVHESEWYTAAGTDNGFIYIYDWRKSRKPIVQFAAHNPMPVHEVAFQQVPPPKSTGKGSRRSSDNSVTSTPPEVPAWALNRSMDTVSSLGTMSVPPGPPSQHTHQPHDDQQRQVSSSTTATRTSVSASQNDIKAHEDSPQAATKLQQKSQASVHISSYYHGDISKSRQQMDGNTPTRSSGGANTVVGRELLQTPPHSYNHINSNVPDDLESLSSRVSETFNHSTRGSAANNVENKKSTVPDPLDDTPQGSQSNKHDHDVSSVEGHIREQLRPVTNQELTEALQLIQYDIHREVHAVIREQVRQFSIAKDETAGLISKLSEQLREVLEANKELRAENERLRRIY